MFYQDLLASRYDLLTCPLFQLVVTHSTIFNSAPQKLLVCDFIRPSNFKNSSVTAHFKSHDSHSLHWTWSMFYYHTKSPSKQKLLKIVFEHLNLCLMSTNCSQKTFTCLSKPKLDNLVAPAIIGNFSPKITKLIDPIPSFVLFHVEIFILPTLSFVIFYFDCAPLPSSCFYLSKTYPIILLQDEIHATQCIF